MASLTTPQDLGKEVILAQLSGSGYSSFLGHSKGYKEYLPPHSFHGMESYWCSHRTLTVVRIWIQSIYRTFKGIQRILTTPQDSWNGVILAQS